MKIHFADTKSRAVLQKKKPEIMDIVHEHIGAASEVTVRWTGHFFSLETNSGNIRIDEKFRIF
jgi:hypothetical protein